MGDEDLKEEASVGGLERLVWPLEIQGAANYYGMKQPWKLPTCDQHCIRMKMRPI